MLTIPSLANLPALPFIDATGKLPQDYSGKIGAYAIFDEHHALQHLGFSRNVLLSLKQSLVRNPNACHWVKVTTIERPSKSQLQDILTQWQAESGSNPYSDQNPEKRWTESIQLSEHMDPSEKTAYADPTLDARAKVKLLKQVSRRLEADILACLSTRGYQDDLRFNPKLKESGLLDVKE